MNRLQNESSLYLRQHAENPVNWQPWDDHALNEARELDRPILLSIGYSACHWCHVMAHESFEDEASASVMNEHYVNIKVDREERPDLDRIYQLSHQLLTGRGGGWPLTLFLDPVDQIPFFAGTYFPPEPRYGMPAFRDLITQLSHWYEQHRGELQGQNEKLKEAINGIYQAAPKTDDALGESAEALILEKAGQMMLRGHDAVNGGFGSAPKFPQAPTLSAMADLSLRNNSVADELSDQLQFTLEQMARSGLRDHLDGGFFRYCVDATWTIPHFEKMLYDNAMLLPLYAEVAERLANPGLIAAAEGIVTWLNTFMVQENGCFSASIDADADGEEGGFHVWGQEELGQLLSSSQLQAFSAAYGLDKPANFEGKAWHLVRARSTGEVARQMDDSETHIRALLDEAGVLLFSARQKRVHPTLDDKVLTSWNALMAEGLVRAGRALQRPDWLDQADAILRFIRSDLWNGKQLLAVHNRGKSRFPAYLDDHAYLLNALMEYLRARWNADHLGFAIDIADRLLGGFEDPEHGGFYFSDNDSEIPIARSMIFQDDATPAGNAIAIMGLQKIGKLIGEQRYTRAAERCLSRGMAQIEESPLAFASMVTAVQNSKEPSPHIIISGTDETVKEDWKKWCQTHFKVDCYLVSSEPDYLPGILREYRSTEAATAWVCQGMHCLAPARSKEQLIQQLEENGAKASR